MHKPAPEITENHLYLIPAAFCQGARDPRCDIGPHLLRQRGAVEALADGGRPASWDMLQPSPVRSLDGSLARYAQEFFEPLAVQVRSRVREHAQFCVIGGDHSCAIGTWSGAAAALREASPGGELGLIWIDAHMDAHTPHTSHTGALHGMPVATLLGHGDRALCGILDAQPKLNPENLCLIGVRSYEQEEAALLRRLGVTVWYMDDVRRDGLAAIFSQAVQQVSRATAGYGISIDLDAVDPVDAPGVGVPVPGGILGYQLLQVLTRVRGSRQFVGAEITELNPRRDHQHKTVDFCKDILTSLFATG